MAPKRHDVSAAPHCRLIATFALELQTVPFAKPHRLLLETYVPVHSHPLCPEDRRPERETRATAQREVERT